jgi:hypothetical protein
VAALAFALGLREQDGHHRAEQVDHGRAARPHRRPEARRREARLEHHLGPVSAACAKVLSALMWKSGSVVHSTSSRPTPSTSALFTPHQKYCACGQTTPLAGPVVPEV